LIRLNDEERQELQTIVKKQKGSSQKVNRAIALFHADANGPDWTNEQIAHRTGLTIRSFCLCGRLGSLEEAANRSLPGQHGVTTMPGA